MIKNSKFLIFYTLIGFLVGELTTLSAQELQTSPQIPSLKNETSTEVTLQYQLHKGWNLLGTLCDFKPSVFSNPKIVTVWKWNGKGWEVYTPILKIANLIKKFNIPQIKEIKAKEGFWVYSLTNIEVKIPKCVIKIENENNSGQETEWDLNKNLVAYWSFDNCDAKDDSGNGNDGKMHGNLKCAKGIKGKALQFDGKSWIDIGKTSILSKALESQSFTVFLCLKPFKVDTKLPNGIIVYWDDDTQSGGDRWIKLDNGEISFTGYKDPTVGKAKISLNTFTCIAYVSDKYNNKSYFYKDGKLVDTVNKPAYPHTNRTFISLGAGHYGYIWDWDGIPDGERFQGVLDEIRIYNKALSEEEIKQLFNYYKIYGGM